ncbi:MAG: hypothetical protein ACXQS8_08315 [Candidatus Helarchaeales archaeon]
MSRRADEKRERQIRQQERSKMIQTIILSTIICTVLFILILSFLIPKLVLTIANMPNVYVDPNELILFQSSPFTLITAILQGIGFVGFLTLFHVLIAGILTLFFIFLYVDLGNIQEYRSAVAGWLELIISLATTLIISLLFFDFKINEYMNVTVFLLTSGGCFLLSIYLYLTQ